MNAHYSTQRMTAIVLRGSLVTSIALGALLLAHGMVANNIMTARIISVFIVILYLLLCEFLVKKRFFIAAGWLIIALYTFVSLVTLLYWGLNVSMGILSIGFVVFLSGLILGPKYIVWVMSIVIVLLISVQYLTYSGLVKPNLTVLAKPSDYFDVLMYITVFSIFALLSWLSSRQAERSLHRARDAEEKLRAEKANLVIKLDKQSRRLHQTQLQEMLRLYKFAEIGQSTTATLHELSNLLSELTLDIDDIGKSHQRSAVITNAKDGISRINHLVKQTRRQLHDNRTTEVFNAIPIIDQTVNELSLKFQNQRVLLTKHFSQRTSFKIVGDTLNLSHIITMLLNNALDACALKNDAHVSIRISQTKDTLSIHISDNGPGIPEHEAKHLFSPHESAKPNGLGIGLYITKHILETQFHGKISIHKVTAGALFLIELPRYKD